MKERLLAVVPVFPEPPSLPQVLSSLKSLDLASVVINDGCGRPLTQKLEASGHRVIHREKNGGVGAATLLGLRFAESEGYQGIVAVDADGAHEYLGIADVVEAARNGSGRLVCTSRFGHGGERYVPESKRSANRLARSLFEEATGHTFHDVASGLRYYPVTLSRVGFRERGFGFIYESLKYALDAELAPPVVPIYALYPKNGPHLTKRTELAQLVSFCQRVQRKEMKSVKALAQLTEGGPASAVVEIANERFSLEAVPGQDSYLIVHYDDARLVDTTMPNPQRPSIGLIIDGGRRWSSREGATLHESYSRSFSQVQRLADLNGDAFADVVLYCLSEYNLHRSEPEIIAALEAALDAAPSFKHLGYVPIAYGNLDRLPPSHKERLISLNRAASRSGNVRLAVLCVAYSPFWEEQLLSAHGEPWRLGLRAGVLTRMADMRFGLVLRSGGASSLSDFMPRAAGYAQLTFTAELFNDLDLQSWLVPALKRLATASYGT